MTATDQHRSASTSGAGRPAPDVVPARPTLSRLLGPTSPTRFAEHHWGRSLHLAEVEQRGDDTFTDLFGLAAVDELVSDRGLRTPFLRVAKDGSTVPDRAFTSGGGIGAGVADQVSEDRVLALFADGATIVLQGLHRTWAPIRDFSAALAAELGHPVQVNAYITPPQNQGFADHYDVHDVFVLQVHGQKHWALREPVLTDPLRDQPWSDRRQEVADRAAAPAHLETTLRPGDCLYLPRGWIHSARALGGVTAHLTIGVHSWTRQHLAEAVLERARPLLGALDQVRASLPLGLDLTDPASLADDVEVAREALLTAIRELPADQVAAGLHHRVRAAQRPAPVAPLAQLQAAQELTAEQPVRLRRHLMVDLGQHDGELTVSSRAGRFTLPADRRPALEQVLTGAPVTPERLGVTLGSGPEEGLQLTRTLLRKGLVVRDTGGYA